MMRYVKCMLLAVALLFLGLAGTGYYMLRYSIGRDADAWNEEMAWEHLYNNYPWTIEWMDSVRQEGVLRDTFIVSDDGRRLHAYFLGHEGDSMWTGGTALLVHGYRRCAIDMMHLGYMYHKVLGYNIFLPDLHAHGQSDGETIRMGWLDRLDVKRWSGVAHELFASPMVVHGISMGAATTMMLSGEEELPGYITHFVEDCGYTSVWDEFKGELSNQFSLPAFPLLNVASEMCDALYGWNFKEASAVRQVARCQRPMLFIHGDADTFVPTWMVHPLYEAHQGSKCLWLPEGVVHALSYRDYPKEYTLRVREFLGR